MEPGDKLTNSIFKNLPVQQPRDGSVSFLAWRDILTRQKLRPARLLVTGVTIRSARGAILEGVRTGQLAAGGATLRRQVHRQPAVVVRGPIPLPRPKFRRAHSCRQPIRRKPGANRSGIARHAPPVRPGPAAAPANYLLTYCKYWCCRTGLNCRPLRYQNSGAAGKRCKR